MNLPFLSLLIFVPLAGGILILLVPKTQERAIKWIATVSSLIPLVLVAIMWPMFDLGAEGMQFQEYFEWIPSLGVSYSLGADGISFPLIALTALMTFVAVVASWSINVRVKDFFFLVLLLETSMMGVFSSLDYVVFYVFFELVLVPMYFLIGIWGGPRREYAAIKFFIYTLVGSLFILIGILALYFGTGVGSFNMLKIAEVAGSKLSATVQFWVFLAMFFGFAIKVPVFPFHTWLPDAHVEAPTPISVVLAAVLLKMGTYGFLRITHPTLPEAAKAFAVSMAILGLINIIYGALAAMAQKDLKKLVAYSSISHMGFVLLGLAAATPAAIKGAMYMNISHGLISGMMFLMVGSIYDRTHTREISKLGGLYITMPVVATIAAFASFANLGLPGLAGFISEFFVLAGTFPWMPSYVLYAVIGMIIVAAFNLWMMQRVLMGQAKEEYQGLPDINGRELVSYVPLVMAIVLLGVYPAFLMDLFTGPVVQLVALLGGM